MLYFFIYLYIYLFILLKLVLYHIKGHTNTFGYKSSEKTSRAQSHGYNLAMCMKSHTH